MSKTKFSAGANSVIHPGFNIDAWWFNVGPWCGAMPSDAVKFNQNKDAIICKICGHVLYVLSEFELKTQGPWCNLCEKTLRPDEARLRKGKVVCYACDSVIFALNEFKLKTMGEWVTCD